eukprot:ANDGO_02101.mRNA.1 hypothetical protein
MVSSEDLVAAVGILRQAAPSAVSGAKPPKRLPWAVETIVEEVASSWDGSFVIAATPGSPGIASALDLVPVLKACLAFEDVQFKIMLQHLVSLLDPSFAPSLVTSNANSSSSGGGGNAADLAAFVQAGLSSKDDRLVLLAYQRLERALGDGSFSPKSLPSISAVNSGNLPARTPMMKAHAVGLARQVVLHCRDNQAVYSAASGLLATLAKDPVANISLPAIAALADGGYHHFLQPSAVLPMDVALAKISEVMALRRRVYAYAALKALTQLCRTSRYQASYIPAEMQAHRLSEVGRLVTEGKHAFWPEVRFMAAVCRIWYESSLDFLYPDHSRFFGSASSNNNSNGIGAAKRDSDSFKLNLSSPGSDGGFSFMSALTNGVGVVAKSSSADCPVEVDKMSPSERRVLLLHAKERISVDTFAVEIVRPVLAFTVHLCADIVSGSMDGATEAGSNASNSSNNNSNSNTNNNMAGSDQSSTAAASSSMVDADVQPVLDILTSIAEKAPEDHPVLRVLLDALCALLAADRADLRIRQSVLWILGRYSKRFWTSSLYDNSKDELLATFRRTYFLVRAQALHPDKLLVRTCVRSLLVFSSDFAKPHREVFREIATLLLTVPDLRQHVADIQLLRELDSNPDSEDVMQRVRAACGM